MKKSHNTHRVSGLILLTGMLMFSALAHAESGRTGLPATFNMDLPPVQVVTCTPVVRTVYERLIDSVEAQHRELVVRLGAEGSALLAQGLRVIAPAVEPASMPAQTRQGVR